MRLSEIHDPENVETVWLHKMTPEEISSLEISCDEDMCLLYDDFIYGKYLEKQRNLGEQQKTQLAGGRKTFVVRGGRKVRVAVRRRAKALSSKQKIALRKARRRAQTGAAKAKRKRSQRIRSRLKLKAVKGGRLGKKLRRNV